MMPITQLAIELADAIQLELNYRKLRKRFGKEIIDGLVKENGMVKVNRIHATVRRAFEEGIWPHQLKMQVGTVLIELLMNTALSEFRFNQPVFRHVKVQLTSKFKRQGCIQMDEEFYKELTGENGIQTLPPRYKPMVVPPRPWRKELVKDDFGKSYVQFSSPYLTARLDPLLTRTSGSREQAVAVKKGNIQSVLDSLNTLSQVKWVINNDILPVIETCWDEKLAIAELPSQDNLVIPKPSKEIAEAFNPDLSLKKSKRKNKQPKIKSGAISSPSSSSSLSVTEQWRTIDDTDKDATPAITATVTPGEEGQEVISKKKKK
jgi:DNA-directed RNA polymerase